MAVGLSARGSSLSLGSERPGIMDFTLRHDPGLIGFGMQSSGVCAKAELPRNSPTQVATTRLAMGKYIVRSEEHTSELQSLMRISYAVFCLKKKNNNKLQTKLNIQQQ